MSLTVDLDFGFWYGALLLVTTEMLGYGLAGICRRWLVYPSDMIWPAALQTSTFLNTMHRDKNNPVGRWTISRYKLFFVAIGAIMAWQLLPQFIPFFEKTDIASQIWPDSKIVNLLFGYRNGLGLLPISLSYQTIIAFLGISRVPKSTKIRFSSNRAPFGTYQYLFRNGILVLDNRRNNIRL